MRHLNSALFLTGFIFAASLFVSLECANNAWASMGVEEIDRLLKIHPIKEREASGDAKDKYSQELPVDSKGESVLFVIPGFKTNGCDRCHAGKSLAERAKKRLSQTFSRLKSARKSLPRPPLRQYIIQTEANSFLQPGQFAHTTFDSIRISPQAILIDQSIYSGATHVHEMVHLTQPFFGAVNELEAYGFNIAMDPRFLLLNYPYFESVTLNYFLPDFDELLARFFDRPYKEELSVAREVQWFIRPFDDKALMQLSDVARSLKPLLEKASELYRQDPVRAAYWTERTGIPSLLLDISAALLIKPVATAQMTDQERRAGLKTLAEQMQKNDNTRLGYVIDRKKESLLTMGFSGGPKNPAAQRILYFEYLKSRFIDSSGKVSFAVDDLTDFNFYVGSKIVNVEKMIGQPGITEIEVKAGEKIIREIQKKSLSSHNSGGEKGS